MDKMRVTTSKSVDDKGKNPNIPDGEDTIFKGDNYVETGDGTLDDLMKTASLSSDAQALYKEARSSQISASFADDDTIRANTNQSQLLLESPITYEDFRYNKRLKL